MYHSFTAIVDMKAIIILCFVGLTISNLETNTNRGFNKLVESLRDDDSIDMEEVLNSEDVYLNGLKSHKDDVLYSEVELLVEEEDDMSEEFDSNDDDMEDGDDSDVNPISSDFPEELDLRDLGVIHKPIYQGLCGSCAYISGTQTLEGRIAYVSENYIPYSIQNFMNCAGRICVGAMPYSVFTQAKKNEFIVQENELPYTKRECVRQGEGKSVCIANCGTRHPDKFTNALHDQFVVLAGTRKAKSLPQLIAALQRGPVNTIFSRNKKPPGEKCKDGGLHANSIIGYTNTDLIVLENYGKRWGPFKNGSWITPKNSTCAGGLIKRTSYPNVLYDYDRANAYFIEIEAKVDEKELQFVDRIRFEITVENTINWGTAKNRCAFLGAICKGVVALSTGSFELVSDFGTGLPGTQKAFRKYQMVIYLKDEITERYIGTAKKKKGKVPLKLVMVKEKSKAAPFFTSYGRFIPFFNPKYNMINKEMVKIKGSIRDIAFNYKSNKHEKWSLENCMLYNEARNKSLDLVELKLKNKEVKMALGSAVMNKTAISQRFSAGISSTWRLFSDKLGLPLRRYGKKKKWDRVFVEVDDKSVGSGLRWQARQLMSGFGLTLEPQPGDIPVKFVDFDVKKTQNVITPMDCAIGMTSSSTKDEIESGTKRYLAPTRDNNELEMTEERYTGWTFEYADL